MKIRKLSVVLLSSTLSAIGMAGLAAEGPGENPAAPTQPAQPIQQAAGTMPVQITGQLWALPTSMQVAPPAIPGGGAAGAASAVGGAAPAAAAPRTLWTFLGLPNCDKIKECVAKIKEHLGIPPCPKAVGAAANLESPNPAVKAAAAVKAEQDAKPAKIQAIRYLAKVENACCYPQAREALLAALDDCDWEIREEAAKAFGKACCCHPDVIKRLEKIVNDRDSYGHYKERYEEVRCAAQRSLDICACHCAPEGKPEPKETPKETPEGPREATGAKEASTRSTRPQKITASLVQPAAKSVLVLEDFDVHVILPVQDLQHAQPKQTPAEPEQGAPAKPQQPEPPYFRGYVAAIEKASGIARVMITDGEFPTDGTRVQLFHRYPLRTVHVGQVEAIGLEEHDGDLYLLIRPAGSTSILQIKKGDAVMCGKK